MWVSARQHASRRPRLGRVSRSGVRLQTARSVSRVAVVIALLFCWYARLRESGCRRAEDDCRKDKNCGGPAHCDPPFQVGARDQPLRACARCLRILLPKGEMGFRAGPSYRRSTLYRSESVPSQLPRAAPLVQRSRLRLALAARLADEPHRIEREGGDRWRGISRH